MKYLAQIILVLSLATPVRAASIKTQHFTFLFHPDGQGLARELSANAETDRAYVVHFLGIDAPERITIKIAATQQQMMDAIGAHHRVESWIAGMAIPAQDLVIISARGNEVFSAREVFLHELGHIYLHIAVGHRPIPRWFDEGFAMYVSGEPALQRLKTLLPAAAMNNLFSLHDLTKHFPSRQPAVQVAYAESMMFVRHLFNVYGRPSILNLIKGLHQGLPFDAAFRRAFGVDLVFVEKAFRRSIGSGSYLLVVLTGSGVLWLVITLILIWVYLRKREQGNEKIQKWQDEDARLLAEYLSRLSDDKDIPQA